MKIKIHPTFPIYLFSVAVFASWQACLSAAAALLVHELSHYAVSILLGERIRSVELAPFGGVMTYQEGKSPSKGLRGIAVAAAGPAGNYLIMALSGLPMIQHAWDAEWIRQMLTANASMLIVNLLPALPLDGGRIVFSVGYYLFGVAGLVRWLSRIGMLVGAGFLALGVYGMICMKVLNLSLLIVGGYLAVYAAASGRVLLAENLYAVIQERGIPARRTERMQLYHTYASVRLLELVEPMTRSGAVAFIYEDELGEHWVGERRLCRALLEAPNAQLWEIASGKGED